MKTLIANGFYEGRSPGRARRRRACRSPAAEAGEAVERRGPATDPPPDPRVPLAFLGTGVDPAATLPEQLTLDRVAPTLAEILGVRWQLPGRARRALSITGLANGDRPRLVLEVVWTGGGTRRARGRPRPRRRRGGGSPARGAVASTEATTGSLPLDPAATLTTIGTGGPPSQHGITGGADPRRAGEVVRPWSDGAPTSVIAALPDDLVAARPVHEGRRRAAGDRSTEGIVGGTWYDTGDVADVTLERRHPAARGRRDAAPTATAPTTRPDVLAVVVAGPASAFAARSRRSCPQVRARGPRHHGRRGGDRRARARRRRPRLRRRRPRGRERAVLGARSSRPSTPGGLFLDQDVLAADGLSSGAAVRPMLGMRDAAGRTVFADAFPGFAVSFARYC